MERRVKVIYSAEIQGYKRAMEEAAQANTKAKTTAEAAGKAADKAAAEVEKQSLAHHAAAKAVGLQYDNTGQLVTMNGKAVSSQQAATHGLQTFSAEAYLAGRAAVSAGEDSAAAAKKAAEAEEVAAAAAEKHKEALENVGAVALGAGALTLAGVGLSIKSYADFDKQMASVDAATHESAENMQLLRDAAVDAGADTAFSAVEAAQGIEEMAKAGVETSDILSGGLNGTLALAAAGALGVGEASEIAASAMVQFGLKGKDIPHIADLLAAGAGKAQGSVRDLGLALSYAGVPAAGMGISIEQTTGTLAMFAKAGIVGEKAGTALRAMLVSMVKPAETTQKRMDELGISFQDTSGKFIGLDGAGQVLQERLGGLDDMTRNAALAQIFGNEALGAAQTLYKNGASGVRDMTAAVDDYGYAADTANRMQDNLAGDLEKLGGAFDTALIKSGSGANEVLRGLVQGLEDVVDAVGKIPTPVLNAAIGIGAVTGGALVLFGTLVTVIPKIAATKTALELLVPAGGKAAGVLASVGRAALPAAAALTAVLIVKKIAEDMLPAAKSTEEMTAALIGLGNGTKSVDEALSKSVFARANNGLFGLKGAVEQVDTAGSAIARLNDLSFSDNLNDFMNNFIDLGGKLPELRKSLEGVDTALSDLTSNGNAELAGKSFKKIAEEAQLQGVSVEKTAKSFPNYMNSLRKLSNELKVQLTDQELLNWAMGQVPQKMLDAQKSTEGQAKAVEVAAAKAEDLAKELEEVGLAADGSVSDIGKFADALFNAGLLSLSSSDAAIAYQASIDAMTDSVIKNGTSLDLNTEQGRNNQTAYNGIAKAAMASMEATAAETLATEGAAAAQAQLQSGLQTSYDDLLKAAGQLGITGDAADTMARKALGIPKEIPIETWVNDKATVLLDGIKAKADSLDGRTVTLSVVEQYTKFISEIKNPTQEDLNGDSFRPGNSLKVPGLTQATGGRMPGYLSGGKLPTDGPGTEVTDGFLGISSAGVPMAMVDAGEWIINRRSSSRYDRELAAINAGTFPKLPGYVNGAKAGTEYTGRSFGSAAPVGQRIDLGGVTIYGATDANAVKRAVVDEISNKFREQGLRL